MSVLRLSDLSTDEEDAVYCKMNEYERKIDSLMNVVGALKNEVRGPSKDLLILALWLIAWYEEMRALVK